MTEDNKPAEKKDDGKIIREAPKPKLLMRDLVRAEHAYGRYSVTLAAGHTIDQMLKPEYWVLTAHLFQADKNSGLPDRAGAIIEVRDEAHTFYAELYVRAVQEKGLVVQMLRKEDIGPKLAPTGNYFYEFNRAEKIWDVKRKSDNETVFSHKLKEEASDWVKKNLKG